VGENLLHPDKAKTSASKFPQNGTKGHTTRRSRMCESAVISIVMPCQDGANFRPLNSHMSGTHKSNIPISAT
jgi:hypothetical protein